VAKANAQALCVTMNGAVAGNCNSLLHREVCNGQSTGVDGIDMGKYGGVP